MLSDDTIRFIAEVFCGDIQGYYSYKTGPKLVRFFNQHFEYRDVYQQGFPSRWAYTFDKIADLFNKNQLNKFLNIILDKNYIMRDMQLDEVKAAEHVPVIITKFNERLKQDKYLIVKKNNNYCLVNEDEDLIFIGGGGFALVYKRKSTGLIVKKLKDEFLSDPGIRSRFKREFNITKSLNDITGVIKVYDFFEDNYSYTMEEAEQTIYRFINENDLSENNKITCIIQVLKIMKQVHDRNVIHRDISPTNILIKSGLLKISDFGLGKDLSVIYSHKTLYTNTLGQYYYCAPEQFMMLKDGDKRSDVYSLGRLLNFIMTKDPNNNNHFLRTVTEKATSQNPAFRFSDSGELLKFVEKSIKYHQDKNRMELLKQKSKNGVLDEDVENYIYELNGEELCNAIIESDGFRETLISFMQMANERAIHIIQSIEDSFRNVCKTWDSYDPIASFAYRVLIGEFSFVTKELSARILRYIARDVNRYHAQRLVEKAIDFGLEPLIEDILQ